MDDLDAFFDRHRKRLLHYLDGEAPKNQGEPGPLQYVAEVLDEWQLLFRGCSLPSPSSEERTFWFALYQLEDLVEYPGQEVLDPYEGILMQQLVTARELLRGGSELPHGFHATRPGEDVAPL